MYKLRSSHCVELKPCDGQKSYYGKAYYSTDEFFNHNTNDRYYNNKLYSYDSMVCEIDKTYHYDKIIEEEYIDYIEIYFPDGLYHHSRTTNKHKRSFLELNGILELISWDKIRNYKRIKIFFKEDGIEIRKEKYSN